MRGPIFVLCENTWCKELLNNLKRENKMRFKVAVLSLLCIASSMQGKWVKKPNMTLEYASNLALNDASNIWATSRGTVYKWEKNAWKQKGQKELYPAALSISSDNTAYAIQKTFIDNKQQSKMLRFDGKQWQPVHTFKESVKKLVVANTNDIWITKDIKPVQPVPFHWDGKKWEQRGSVYLSHIGVGADGTVMGIAGKVSGDDLIESLVQWDGKKWKELFAFKEHVSELAVFDKTSVWIAKSETKIPASGTYLYKWDPKSKQWIKKAKMMGPDLIAGGDGSLWSTGGDDGEVYQWEEIIRCVDPRLPNGPCLAAPPKFAPEPAPVKRPMKETVIPGGNGIYTPKETERAVSKSLRNPRGKGLGAGLFK